MGCKASFIRIIVFGKWFYQVTVKTVFYIRSAGWYRLMIIFYLIFFLRVWHVRLLNDCQNKLICQYHYLMCEYFICLFFLIVYIYFNKIASCLRSLKNKHHHEYKSYKLHQFVRFSYRLKHFKIICFQFILFMQYL